MTVPKYKQSFSVRANRLNTGKPHIYWSKIFGEWLSYGKMDSAQDLARDFCEDQDTRWTPRSHK